MTSVKGLENQTFDQLLKEAYIAEINDVSRAHQNCICWVKVNFTTIDYSIKLEPILHSLP
jgi:hypothetical protein